MYLAELTRYFVEKDNIEIGCYGDITDKTFDLTFKADTLEEVKQDILEWFDCEDLQYDEHNKVWEMGRMENDDAFSASDKEYEQFRQGKIDLWYASIAFTIYELKIVEG